MEDSAQKARLYDLIIDRAKNELDACDSQDCDTANLIFRLIPELNIYKDETVKEAIFRMVYNSDNELWSGYNVSKNDVLAYLKNQGKQTSSTKKDAPFEEKPANKFKPLYTIGDIIIPLNDEMCEVVGILMPFPDRAVYSLRRMSDICGAIFEADASTIDSTATRAQRI